MKKTYLPLIAAAALAVTPAIAADSSKKVTESGTAQVTFYNAQASNQHLASSVMGAPVKNLQDETIGDVNDAVIDEGGKVAALVVGVGGFLGVGEKDVAVSVNSVDIEKDEDKNVIVRVNASKQQLEKAAEFKTTAPTLSERWEKIQKSVQKQAASVKKSVEEQAASMKSKMNENEQKNTDETEKKKTDENEQKKTQ